ncbi:hypothetical protein LCGC14_2724640, partial [marine sediment metagenome]
LKIYISLIIVIIATFGGFSLKWQFDKDFISLSRDNTVIAKEKWVVEAERTWFSLETCKIINKTRVCKSNWYAKNVKCSKVIASGGYQTLTRCYYPDDYYEQLSRSLINTKITYINETNKFTAIKKSPNYKYGTRGAYAGFVEEIIMFDKQTDMEENFPKGYSISWKPKDTRNYKLTWRIENLKEINLPDGEYHNCKYEFGKIKIDLKGECSKLTKAVISDNSKIYFHFNNARDNQYFDMSLVDPDYFSNGCWTNDGCNYTRMDSGDPAWSGTNATDGASIAGFGWTINSGTAIYTSRLIANGTIGEQFAMETSEIGGDQDSRIIGLDIDYPVTWDVYIYDPDTGSGNRQFGFQSDTGPNQPSGLFQQTGNNDYVFIYNAGATIITLNYSRTGGKWVQFTTEFIPSTAFNIRLGNGIWVNKTTGVDASLD